MISVILYGRNDSYGYNLHKRGAISLNCLAEVLTDPDDEIVFVDYNTPNELPTFVEAIYDTLTQRAKARLRVLRVRPELHRRLAGPSHLAALEPHSRNIAIRRSKPRNRWILLTNTDMVFVPRSGASDIDGEVAGLADGLYTLPRFELPEPLWESFPRADPATILRACRELGPRLHLDEVTHSFSYSRFDQVGDFQLVPRQALFDIHGFDERMILGWHCDSNIAKRLHLFYGGCTHSLRDRLKGYHCDHTRVATGAHRIDRKVDNDVNRFLFAVDNPFAVHQAETWGAPNETVEELDFARDPQARYAVAVQRALGAPQQAPYESDAIGMRNFVPVRAEHVLPYLASDLAVFRRPARFAYIGNHARMLSLAARCIAELGFETPLAYAASLLRSGPPPDGARPIEAADLPGALLADYDLLIFDLSLDAALLGGKLVERVTDWPRPLRYSLGAVARCLEACAERAGAGGARVPEVMAINANHHTFRDFVNQFLLLTFTPFATHVRKGRPRVGEERRSRSNTWKYTEDSLRAFFGYDVEDDSAPPVALNESVDFTSAGHPARFKDGHWGATDYTGTWTDGDRAVFVFQPPPAAGNLLVCVRVNEVFLGPEGDPMRVEVLLDGARLAHWSFYSRYEMVDARAAIPAALLAGKPVCRLEFHVETPQSAARVAVSQGVQVIGDDPRMLGFKVQRIIFLSGERRLYNPGQTLDFTAGGTGAMYANECWALPDNLGMQTLGPHGTVTLLPSQPMEHARATFTVNDLAIGEGCPSQTVRVLFDGRPVANWTLGPPRDVGELRILLPPGALAPHKPSTFAFEIATPRTPVELGWSNWDTRPLGFRLAKLRIAPVRKLKYRLGEPIDFVDAEDFLLYAGEAAGTEWSLPGARGSWTLGNRATFRVPFEEQVSGDLPMAFVISDCMVSAGAARLPVTVKANGQAVAQWVLEKRGPHRQFATIPAAVLAGSGELTVAFEIAEPRSPESLGWSADSRPLGFQLARAVAGRNQVEIPRFKAVGRERPMYRRLLGLPRFALHVARILARRILQ